MDSITPAGDECVSPDMGSRTTRALPQRSTRRRTDPPASSQDLGGTLQLLQPTEEDLGGEYSDGSDDEDGGPSSGKKRKSKSSVPRRHIKIEYIHDKSRRNITFTKRKTGIIKKAHELSVLTGCEILLLVASHDTDQVYTFTTGKLQPLTTDPVGRSHIQNCLRWGTLHGQPTQPQPGQHHPAPPPPSPPERSAYASSVTSSRPAGGMSGLSSMPPPPLSQATYGSPYSPDRASTRYASVAPSTAAGGGRGGAPSLAPQAQHLDPYKREMSAPPPSGMPSSGWEGPIRGDHYGGGGGNGGSGGAGGQGAGWRPQHHTHRSLSGGVPQGGVQQARSQQPVGGYAAPPSSYGTPAGNFTPLPVGATNQGWSGLQGGQPAGGGAGRPGTGYLEPPAYGRRSSEGEAQGGPGGQAVSGGLQPYAASDEGATGVYCGTRLSSSGASGEGDGSAHGGVQGQGTQGSGQGQQGPGQAHTPVKYEGDVYDSTPYLEPGALADPGDGTGGGGGYDGQGGGWGGT